MTVETDGPRRVPFDQEWASHDGDAWWIKKTPDGFFLLVGKETPKSGWARIGSIKWAFEQAPAGGWRWEGQRGKGCKRLTTLLSQFEEAYEFTWWSDPEFRQQERERCH